VKCGWARHTKTHEGWMDGAQKHMRGGWTGHTKTHEGWMDGAGQAIADRDKTN